MSDELVGIVTGLAAALSQSAACVFSRLFAAHLLMTAALWMFPHPPT